MFKVKIISRRGILFCCFVLSMIVVMVSGLSRRLPILFGGSGWVDVLLLHTLVVLSFYFIVLFQKVDYMRHLKVSLRAYNLMTKSKTRNLNIVGI